MRDMRVFFEKPVVDIEKKVWTIKNIFADQASKMAGFVWQKASKHKILWPQKNNKKS